MQHELQIVDEDNPLLEKERVQGFPANITNLMTLIVESNIANLNEKDITILRMRHPMNGEKKATLKEVSKKVGLSIPSVVRREEQILAELRLFLVENAEKFEISEEIPEYNSTVNNSSLCKRSLTMAEIVWVDENGQELKREPKGRGRPPKGAEKRDDGNFYVPPVEESRFVSKYIVLDDDGNVLEEEPKGRGRAKPGFEKMDEGQYKGHWLKIKNETDVA
jgi:hypothetical protein